MDDYYRFSRILHYTPLLVTPNGGDGVTTFALPDLRGRVPVGAGTGPGLSPVLLGQQLGTETVTLTQANLPSHTHPIAGQTDPTSATGGGQSFSTIQPSLGLNPVIAVEGIFPSSSLSAIPTLGSIDWFAGNFAPVGTLFAHGQLLPIDQYPELFAIIGTIYGGDGQSTFALPDLRGRTPVHYGSGPGLPSVLLGQQGGTNTVTLTTGNLPSHTHTVSGLTASSTDSTGSSQPFSNLQPYLGVNYQIALQGIFPSRDLGTEEETNGSESNGSDVVGLVAGEEIFSNEVALEIINDLAQVGIAQWKAAGITEEQIALLESTTYHLADLASGRLAFVGENNQVTIDADASNIGWFVDDTPWDHLEFGSTDPVTGELLATESSALRNFDLLTAIMHEQGHILGLEHTLQPGTIMYGALGTGGRFLPSVNDLMIFAAQDDSEHHDSEPHDAEPYLSAYDSFLAGVGMFAGNFPVRGFAQTDGQLLLINQNQALFSLLGTTYGGNGSTTFALPDLRGRAVMHPGQGQGQGLSSYPLGARGGSATTTLTTATMPAHTHTFELGNTPPVITSLATASVQENQTSAIDVNATDDNDAEGAGLTYSFSGGADDALFNINTSNGVITFKTAPDFEAPIDAGGNNIYDIQVTVTDSGGLTDVQAIAITVTNVDEAPTAIAQFLTVQLDASGQATITAADIDGGSTDDIGIASRTVSPNTFNGSNLGDNLVTLTVTDTGGNTDTATTIVTVQDLIAPILTIPPNLTIAPSDSTDPTNTGQATAIDNADTNVAITFSDNILANGTIERTWTATDDAGNTDDQIQLISFEPAPLVNGQLATVYVDSNGVVIGSAFQNGQPFTGDLFSNTDGTTNPNDVIAGTAGDDNIWAGSEGDDVIDAGEGNNRIGIGTGDSQVTAGSGDDFIYSVAGGGGTNVIDLGDGNNAAYLEAGDNTLTAGNGDNTFGLGTGDDTVTTGNGDDFIYSVNGGGGTDTFDLGNGNNKIWVENGDCTITTGTGADEIGLGTGSDTVNAGDGNNVIYMLNAATAGNKDILTGAGDDYVQTGAGTDFIDAGLGFNTLLGGTGADVFVTRSGAYNYLGDFEVGIDQIDLFDLAFGDLTFFQGTGADAADAFAFNGADALLQVANTTVAQLNNAANFT